MIASGGEGEQIYWDCRGSDNRVPGRPRGVAGAGQDRAVPEAQCGHKTSRQKYSEIPVATGLTNNGAVLEVLSLKTGKNWTIMVTLPNGTACMIAAGQNWEQIPFAKIFGPMA